jgi:hypothetical protein
MARQNVFAFPRTGAFAVELVRAPEKEGMSGESNGQQYFLQTILSYLDLSLFLEV